MEANSRRGGNNVPVYRRAAWDFIREHGAFTTADLAETTGMHWRSACHLARQLADAGVVEPAGKVRRGATGAHMLYRLKDRYTGTPRLIDPVGYWHRQAWQAMRIHRGFTPVDVLRTISPAGVISGRSVKAYCEQLASAGILRKRGRARENGKPGSETVYFLMRDIGPEPPALEALKEPTEKAVSEAL